MMLTEIQAFFRSRCTMYRSRCTDESIRSKEWIEIGVGRDIKALGAARGCTDFPATRAFATIHCCMKMSENCNECKEMIYIEYIELIYKLHVKL